MILRILSAFKRQIDKYRREAKSTEANHARNERVMADWTRGLGIFTVILAIVAVIGLVVSTCALRDAENQLTLQFPPVLRPSNFIIWQEGHKESEAPASLVSGEQIQGVAWIANTGREPATIVGVFCDIFWEEEPLPMYRPYIGRTREFQKPTRTLNPGDIAKWDLSTQVPEGRTDTQNLYILGFVQYLDRLGTHRALYFARRYDERERRFVKATDNPDYESEE